jgi:hypothetical protein
MGCNVARQPVLQGPGTHSVVTNTVPEPTGSVPPNDRAVFGHAKRTASPGPKLGPPSAARSLRTTRTCGDG